MKVQTVTQTIRLQSWVSEIQECRQSGQSVREWCAQHGLSPKTYYYHLKRIREELLEDAESRKVAKLPGQPVFAALPMPRANGAAVTVRIGQNVAEIADGADADTVERVLRVLAGL